MRDRAAPRQKSQKCRRTLPARNVRQVRTIVASILVGGMVGAGVLVLEGSELTDGTASAIVPPWASAGTSQEALDPRGIPTVETSTEPAGADGRLEVERSAPDADAELESEPGATSSRKEVTAEEILPPSAEELPDMATVPPEQVPDGEPVMLSGGGETKTVATVSGTGTLRLGFTRTASSAAPNLPTYVSALCDGESVYSGAFNTTSAGPVIQDVPFSGESCAIKVKVAQPSARWAGTSSAVVVTRDETTETQEGKPYIEDATWTSTAVSDSRTFELTVPEGFTGAVSVKLTACSSDGGTSDETTDFGCRDLVERGVGSEGVITISDGEKQLASSEFDISAETHHDMVTLDVEEPAADDLTITVEKTGGSAVLVHGPGTGVVGAH